jgi:hypothetical protein
VRPADLSYPEWKAASLPTERQQVASGFFVRVVDDLSGRTTYTATAFPAMLASGARVRLWRIIKPVSRRAIVDVDTDSDSQRLPWQWQVNKRRRFTFL